VDCRTWKITNLGDHPLHLFVFQTLLFSSIGLSLFSGLGLLLLLGFRLSFFLSFLFRVGVGFEAGLGCLLRLLLRLFLETNFLLELPDKFRFFFLRRFGGLLGADGIGSTWNSRGGSRCSGDSWGPRLYWRGECGGRCAFLLKVDDFTIGCATIRFKTSERRRVTYQS